jgi:hypothetical protein
MHLFLHLVSTKVQNLKSMRNKKMQLLEEKKIALISITWPVNTKKTTILNEG